jgi:crotonobetainyl-CoA:carnitine CoA-transferase CaiB-like acyl-CoA transferase
MHEKEPHMAVALDSLRVVDLSNTLIGTQMSQLLADFGADVVHVEPPGGSPLRSQPAWPFWGRGKRSVVLDLKENDDLEIVKSLARTADVLLETWRPDVAEGLGLGYEALAAENPRLVYASVTGFGRDNPLSNLKGYEPIVMAKIGGLDAFSSLTDRPGPSFVSTPYTGWSAGQLALQGILAALFERESSGVGQRLESTMVQGILAHDTWNWLIAEIVKKYAGAFAGAAATDSEELVPHSHLFFRLMVGLSKDGRWMQFSQTTDRLWEAFLRLTGLDAVLADPAFKDAPSSEDPAVRVAFWEKALAAVRTKTYDEWLVAFKSEPDVWAEMFRTGSELLHHPQMVHDEQRLSIEDPKLGAVLQPGPMVKMQGTPAAVERSAPVADEHGDAVRSEAAATPSGTTDTPSSEAASGRPPLEGVTVVELGTFYAAPFGATLLADLGARVIKIEQLDGDPMRSIMPFPELGGIKVLQGKESIAVDMTNEEGRAIVLELVKRADAVLQTFRAGVADRHGYTAEELLAVNPDLVYLNAPGYGIDGPMGACPAFAPTMGAGSGLGYRNVGGPLNLAQGPDLELIDVKRNSMRLSVATLAVGHADGFAALGVGTALLLGLLAKKRGRGGQSMMTSMLSTMAHALSEDMIEYEGRADMQIPDAQLLGFGARWRLYETAEGWVFLAAPAKDDWTALAKALDLGAELADDDAALTAVLEEKFRTRPASEWEEKLTALDVACVEVVKGPVEEVVMLGGELGKKLDIVTTQTHPVLDEYPRLSPMVRFSRSEGVAGPAPLCGAHSDSILAELGFDSARIEKLREQKVIG